MIDLKRIKQKEQMQSTTFKVIGLTGGIASGKSLVAKFLSQHKIPVISLDRLGAKALGEASTQKAVAESFGITLAQLKKLDRHAIRELVFHDAKKRKQLESLLHPRIMQLFQKQCQRLEKKGHRLVVGEAALFIEKKLDQSLDGLIVVLADEKIRKSRAKDRDKISDKLISAILKTQTTDAIRRRHASVIIHNHGTQKELSAKVDALVQSWKAQGWI